MKVRDRFDKNRIGELVCDGAFKYVQNFAVEINGKRVAEYGSLDGVAEEWEDYTPAEPLIKDEKIRKAVKVWADASGIEKVTSYGDYFWIGFVSENTDSVWKFECNYKDASEFKYDKQYTIAELCGEE